MKARLIGDNFIKLFLAFRIVNIQGRFGGGKSLLGTWLAYYLMANGYTDKIVSNMPVNGSADEGGLLERSAIILDESWMYITTRKDVLNYSAYLRKMDSYLILPSVFDIQSRLARFTVERQYNLQSFGIPVWVYRWDLNNKRKEHGYFVLTFPQRMYGTYDTKHIPFNDGGISDRLVSTIESRGHPAYRVNADGYDDNTIDFDGLAMDIDNGVSDMGQKIEEFEEIIKRSKRKV